MYLSSCNENNIKVYIFPCSDLPKKHKIFYDTNYLYPSPLKTTRKTEKTTLNIKALTENIQKLLKPVIDIKIKPSKIMKKTGISQKNVKI